MRYSALLTILVSLTLTSAGAQVKKGGLFGFGADDDQISADLFPTKPVSTTSPSNSAPAQPSRGADDTIFRGGEPAEVDAVSYVIENGERVEKKVESKKKSFFGFGKKPEKELDEAIAPVPAPSYQPANVIEVPAELAQAPVAVETAVEETSEAIREAVNTPPPVEEKKKSGGLFSFFGKKSEEIPDTPAFVMADEIVEVEEAVTAVSSAAAPTAPATSSPTAAPVAATPAAATPVPQFAGMEPQAKPEKDGFSLPNPLAKIRNQKEEKTIDLTGAETIIQNGEIVEAADDIVESNRVVMEGGDRQPPRIVDGVKTYSSWDDVNARSVSAADKILNQIR